MRISGLVLSALPLLWLFHKDVTNWFDLLAYERASAQAGG